MDKYYKKLIWTTFVKDFNLSILKSLIKQSRFFESQIGGLP